MVDWYTAAKAAEACISVHHSETCAAALASHHKAGDGPWPVPWLGDHLLRAVPGLSKPGVRVGSDSEFRRMWLQRAGRCADSSFLSRISVTDRGLVARGNGEKGREVGSYECRVGRVSR